MMEMFYTNCMQTIVLATKEAELQELRRRHEKDEEVVRHKEELINQLSQRCQESTSAKEAVIASHMEKQGVHLEEEDKKNYARDLASSSVILRVLKIIWKYARPGVLMLLKKFHLPIAPN
ncbi:uncharacterized protein LOC135373680 [Ornithodoros turicata]|uniref:uncharacterized protein LOC135373680 n=1 Tax=Ornithodoros turicata TaxID=34597 RepID=UPI003138F8A4